MVAPVVVPAEPGPVVVVLLTAAVRKPGGRANAFLVPQKCFTSLNNQSDRALFRLSSSLVGRRQWSYQVRSLQVKGEQAARPSVQATSASDSPFLNSGFVLQFVWG